MVFFSLLRSMVPSRFIPTAYAGAVIFRRFAARFRIVEADYFFATLLTWNFEPSPFGSTLMVITLGGKADTIVQ